MRKMLFGTLAAGVVAAALVFATSAEAAAQNLCWDHWAIAQEGGEKGGGKPEPPEPPEEPEGEFLRLWTKSGSHFSHDADVPLFFLTNLFDCFDYEAEEPEEPEEPEI